MKAALALSPQLSTSGITESETTTVSRTVVDTRELLNQPLESSDRERPGPLADHKYRLLQTVVSSSERSAGRAGDSERRCEGTPGKTCRRCSSTPWSVDKEGRLWAGARARKEEPGSAVRERTRQL